LNNQIQNNSHINIRLNNQIQNSHKIQNSHINIQVYNNRIDQLTYRRRQLYMYPRNPMNFLRSWSRWS
jgi:hypothetical protein